MDRSVDNPSQLQVDLSRPRYDQGTFAGRAKYFFETANPLNLLVSSKRLEKAAELVELHRYDRTVNAAEVSIFIKDLNCVHCNV